MIVLPRRLQPRFARIDRSASITRGLIGGFNAANYGALSPMVGPASGPLGFAPVGGEMAIFDAGTTASQTVWNGNPSPESGEFTVLVRGMRFGAQPDGGFGMAFVLSKAAGTQDPFHLFIKNAGERFRFNTTTVDNTESNETNTDWVVNQWMTGVYRWRSGEAATAWRNGVQQTLSITASVTRTGVLKPAVNMAVSVSTLRLNGAVSLALIWNRALTDQEIVTVSRNPWRVFEPETIYVKTTTAATFNPAWARGSNASVIGSGVHA